MASTKPNKTARWATDGGTTLEPLSGEKDTGWVVEEKPPARHMNFLQNIAFQWFRWLDERHDDGGTPADYVTHPEDPATGAGGAGTFRGGDSVDAAGGAATFRAGDSAAGVGGSSVFRGGDSVGTNAEGGDADLVAGTATGTGSSQARIKASTSTGSSGTTPNVPEDYLVADGSSRLVQLFKGLITPSALLTRAIDVITDDISTARMTRESDFTSSPQIVLDLIHQTSVESADGLGAQLQFNMEDATSGFQPQVQIQAERDGADNSGELVLRPRLVGTFVNALRLRATGLGNFLRGLQADGITSNINGAGGLGRGITGAGALGVASAEQGVGLHGVGSEIGGGSTTGYGMVAEGSDTGTPSRSSMRVFPQTNEPSQGERGAFWIDDLRGLSVHDGTNWDSLAAKVFTQLLVSNLVANSTAEESFGTSGNASSHVVPADTLQVGSKITVVAIYDVTSIDGTDNLTLRYRWGDDINTPAGESLFASAVFTSVPVAHIRLELEAVIISSISANVTAQFTLSTNGAVTLSHTAATGAPTFALSAANELFGTAQWSAAAVNNQVRLAYHSIELS